MKKKHTYSQKVNKDNRVKHFNQNTLWIIKVTLIAFTMSLLLSLFSEVVISNSSTIISLLVLLIFILLGIIFDMIGISATVADAKVFNSMAAKRIRGSKTALKLIKNNSKVSSFCNDVIGDICGVLSGGAGVTIAISLSKNLSMNLILANLLVTASIAAITIGGKACGKSLAINKANVILYKAAQIMNIFNFKEKKK